MFGLRHGDPRLHGERSRRQWYPSRSIVRTRLSSRHRSMKLVACPFGSTTPPRKADVRWVPRTLRVTADGSVRGPGTWPAVTVVVGPGRRVGPGTVVVVVVVVVGVGVGVGAYLVRALVTRRIFLWAADLASVGRRAGLSLGFAHVDRLGLPEEARRRSRTGPPLLEGAPSLGSGLGGVTRRHRVTQLSLAVPGCNHRSNKGRQ